MLHTIVLELDKLTLDYHCVECGGLMVETRTIAHERSLTCCRCGHEVMWITRFASCKVAEWSPVLAAEAR